MILGIDFSLNGTGLSIIDSTFNLLDWKVFTVDHKLAEMDSNIILIPSKNTQELKLDWVCETIKDYIQKVDFICLEQQIGLNFSWADGYGILKYFCRKLDKPYITAAPTAVKAFAGSGKADKIQMGYFLRKEYNLDFDFIGSISNNVVDATWLAIIGNIFQNIFVFNKPFENLCEKRLEILNKIAISNKYIEKPRKKK